MGVADFISNAQGYANSVLADATTAINVAISEANKLKPGITTSAGVNLGGDGSLISIPGVYFNVTPPPLTQGVGDAPQWSGSSYTDPGLTATEPVLDSVLPIDVSTGAPGTVPSVATFNDPTELRPVGDPGDPQLLNGLPTITDISAIDPKDLLTYLQSLPVPTIHTLTVKDAPTYSPPQFLGTSPTLPGDAPTDLDTQLSTEFSRISPIMLDAITTKVDAYIDGKFPGFRTGLQALEDRLNTYLAGGTALTAEVQDAIFERASNKADAEYRRARYKVFADGAQAGHSIPGAITLSQVRGVDKDRRDANAAVARDLMVKMAEMEQQNLQFAVTQSAALRNIMLTAAMQYYSGLVQINGQALDYARTSVEMVARVYELAIKKADLESRIYEAEANIYDSKTKGALAVLEAYATYVKGLEATANLDLAAANVYRAQLDAVQAQATVYKAYTDSLLAKASVEKMRVDLYRSKIDAYAAQVSAYSARWQGYKAAVDGETASVQASAEAVRGYSAQVDAFRARVQAQTASLEAVVKRNDGLIRNYEAAVQAYRAKVEGLSTSKRAEIESYDTTIKAYIAEQNKVADENRAAIARYEAGIRALVAAADVQQKLLAESHNLDIHRVNALTALSTSAANNYAAVAQSALSGINSLAAQVVNE